MKGFTKGKGKGKKFIPTSKKNGLKKDQVRSKKTLPKKGEAPRGEFQMQSTFARGKLPSSKFGHHDDIPYLKQLDKEHSQLGRADRGRSKGSNEMSMIDIEKEKNKNDKLTAVGLRRIIDERLEDEGLDKLDYPSNGIFHEIEVDDDGNLSFKLTTQSRDEFTKDNLEKAGFKISDVRDILDSRHMNVKAKITDKDDSRSKNTLDAHPNPSPNYGGKEVKSKSLKDKERFVDRAIQTIDEENIHPSDAKSVLREKGFEPDVIKEAIRIRGKFS